MEAAFKELMEFVGIALTDPTVSQRQGYGDEANAWELTAAEGVDAEYASKELRVVPLVDSVSDASPREVPRGAWSPFMVVTEKRLRLGEVQPPASQPDVMQLHVVTPARAAGFILGRHGARIQEIATRAACRVWMTSRQVVGEDRMIVCIGTFRQCKIVQELVHEQLANASGADWRDIDSEVILLVRREAVGVVMGKQGFVLNQIRKQSGADIRFVRLEAERQQPCVVSGTLNNVLQAQRHIFDLVRAVPLASGHAVTAVPPSLTEVGQEPSRGIKRHAALHRW